MSAPPIIEMREVTIPSRRDNELPVAEKVSWSVSSGELWIVGGLLGSAKSDFIFLLGGLTRPLGGSYLLFGQDMGKHFGDEFLPNRLRTAIVFDDARLFATQTIAENVALPIRYHQNLTPEESAGWVAALLQETGVAEMAGEKPGTVSRQWRRRAALARALALRPELIFVENALRGLDARHASWWVDFLGKLQKGHSLMAGKPMTVVATTDEYWPWRNSGARFAALDGGLAVTGFTAPPDHAPLAPWMVGERTEAAGNREVE